MDYTRGLVGGQPQFNGMCYFYSISQIFSYFRSTKIDVWSLIEDGWIFPMHISKIFDIEPKLINVWNKEKLHLSNLNYQGLYLFIDSNTGENYSLISNFTNIKESWDFLEKKYDRCSHQMSVLTLQKTIAFMASHSKTAHSSFSYWTNIGENNKFSLQE